MDLDVRRKYIFKPKIDNWWIVSNVTGILLFLYLDLISRVWIFAVVAVIPAMALSLSFLTRYIITDKFLILKCLFINWHIPLDHISKIEKEDVGGGFVGFFVYFFGHCYTFLLNLAFCSKYLAIDVEGRVFHEVYIGPRSREEFLEIIMPRIGGHKAIEKHRKTPSRFFIVFILFLIFSFLLLLVSAVILSRKL